MEKLPDYLLYGFGIASIGGPLAIVALYLFTTFQPNPGYLFISTLIGILLFLFPLKIWYDYSKRTASSGGLYEFVRIAANERIARVQGYLWIFSYALYLPYTITYMLFYLLPDFIALPQAYLYALEIILPVGMSLSMLLGKRAVLWFLTVIAVLQLVLIGALDYTAAGAGVAAPISNMTQSNALGIGAGAISVSLLFICGSLILFMGGEANDPRRTIRKILVVSFAIVALFVLASSVFLYGPFNSMKPGCYICGFAMAEVYTNQYFAFAIGLFALLSTAALIYAEFFALSRVMYSMLKIKIQNSIIYISAFFIIADAISIANPIAFYNYTLAPSLVALFASQLIVFAVYPSYMGRYFRASAASYAIAIISSVLVVYGLYGILVGL